MRETLKKAGQGGVRRVTDFKEGFFSPFRGLRYMFAHPGTLKFALPPVPIIAGLLALALWMTFGHSDVLISMLWDQPDGAQWYSKWLLVPLWYILWLISVAAMTALGVVVVALLAIPIAGPFMELLAEKVEAIETGFEAPFSWTVTVKNLAVTAIHVTLFTSMSACIAMVGFALGFIPILGQVLAVIVSLTIVPIMLAFTPLDYPMTVRLWTFGDKMRFMWRNLWRVFGFALATYLFLYIPFLNLLLLPACVIAATRTIIELDAEGRLKTRDRRKEVLVAHGKIETELTPPGGDSAVA